MEDASLDRREFLAGLGKCCLGSCLCGVALGLSQAYGGDTARAESAAAGSDPSPPPAGAGAPRSQTRIEFAEKWVRRFMNVLDGTLDEATRKKVMLAAGRACFLEYIKDTGQQIRPVTMEQLARWAARNAADGSVRIDGNVIYYQYMTAAETGLPSEEGACLCSLVETKPAGLSGTYCLCSVGYVKQWHEMLLARPVEVELLESALMGGKRCRFKITVS